MPYKIKKVLNGYKVCNIENGHCFSSYPMTYEKALSQLRAIQIHSHDEKHSSRNTLHRRGGETFQESYTILGIGNNACVFSIQNLAFKCNFITPTWKKNEDTNKKRNYKEFLQLQNKIKEIDIESKYFIPILHVTEMLSTYPPVQECLNKFNKKRRESEKNEVEWKIVEIYIQQKVKPAPPVSEWSENQIRHAFQGLLYLHQNNICHTDIHIGNYGFDYKNNPVLIDMDSAWYETPLSRNADKKINMKGTKYQDIQDFIKMINM